MSNDPVVWLGEARTGGRASARIGRDESYLIAEWRGIGRLRARRDGTDARFEPFAGADPLQVAKVEAGAVVMLLRSLEGRLGLHAASVAVGTSSVVLLGEGGEGKSTLAAALCECGAGLLADDVAALDYDDQWNVAPVEKLHFLDAPAIQALGLSVLRRSAAEKAAVAPRAIATQKLPLVALLKLTFDPRVDEPRLVELRPMDAMAAVVPQTIRFAIDDPERHRAEIDRLVHLVSSVPAFMLARPRRLEDVVATATVVSEMVTRLAGDALTTEACS